MKKIVMVLLFTTALMNAQDVKTVSQISVSGEGKIKVIPDEALITVAVENSGKEATEVKKKNDEIVDKVLKLIKQNGIAITDFQTQRINLYKNYDYDTKKYNYVANQTLSIHLKNLSKYDKLMMDLVESGINSIQGVEFKSSKIKELETQARKKAMQNAKQKADDYVSVLEGQKVGKALVISDNSNTNYPTPIFAEFKTMAISDTSLPKETLAIGEIEIVSNVNVTFILD
ncbi:SIMPL domain-containing protein [Flavobacterium sp. HXWNR69]|uniref:SIMPL domain-containing protein n=1 Tax=Flavobacterium fragile TaxID=2949085 RepID=A0ABT0TI07_9FLAO|nr:SIMPL domain-containing protein [Flavobacterium sp. HXWNR69]MCL9770221.1 SIMPL domain-containing protein [Flavobacterium sp. HXWNR69]